MVRPCFFFSEPEIAPRTLCGCQFSVVAIWAMVAPSLRRSMPSSWLSLVFAAAADAVGALRFFLPGPGVVFCFVIVGSMRSFPALCRQRMAASLVHFLTSVGGTWHCDDLGQPILPHSRVCAWS